VWGSSGGDTSEWSDSVGTIPSVGAARVRSVRAVVIMNPNATTTNPYQREVLVSALHGALDLTVVQTTHRNHATEVAATAEADGFDLVIAHGGDGTVNEAVNGLLAEGPGPNVPVLGIIPGGSANVLARNLGIPRTPILATRTLIAAVRDPAGPRVRRIGLGTVDQRWFTFNSGVGIDAEAVRHVERARARGKRASPSLYLRSAVRAYVGNDRDEGALTIRIGDGVPAEGYDLLMVTNCSPWTYMGALPVVTTPRASFDAGLDVVASSSARLLPLLGYGAQILATRQGPRGSGVLAEHDVGHVSMRSTCPMPLQVDGDYIGETSAATFRSWPAALRVLTG
jgi:diacylglycerol kinase family enzyme